MDIAIIDMDELRNPFWAAGQARATREVGKRLVARGHEVTVYTSKYPGYEDYIEDGISYKHIGITSSNPRLTNALFILSIPFTIVKIKADIILENFTAPISVSFAPLFTKIPVVGLPTMFNSFEFSRKYRLPFHLVERIGFHFYRYLLPYSSVDSAKAKRLNPKIIYKIVSQGVGDEYFNIRSKKPKHILYLSRFDMAQKGVDLLIKAYALVADKIKYPLVLAGHGPDETAINNMIAQLGIGSKVTVVGRAYGDNKYRLMSESLFTVFPSRHDEMSLWCLESLAAGLPLVCFDLPESRWLNKDVSIKAKPFNISQYAELLLETSNGQKVYAMKELSRKFACRFSWDKTAQEFEKFFQYVLRLEKKA